jgi:hypothetical protein
MLPQSSTRAAPPRSAATAEATESTQTSTKTLEALGVMELNARYFIRRTNILFIASPATK